MSKKLEIPPIPFWYPKVFIGVWFVRLLALCFFAVIVALWVGEIEALTRILETAPELQCI